MRSAAATVDEYLQSLSPERRDAIACVRDTICQHIDPVFEEGMQYGMIGYYVPHAVFPAGYHCDPKQPLPFAGIASQKNHMAVYLMGIYQDKALAEWFEKTWKKTGKKLDMGACCVRFKKIEDLPLDVLAQAFRKMTAKKYIAGYEAALSQMKKPVRKKATAKKSPAKAKKSAKSRR
jgi:hypothetical protein